ncbi:MAG TPA: DNA polymerase I, partial [Acidimicrobiia bacterium]|nr:DNA polymerase I [Acidimicrobiia bacterium]
IRQMGERMALNAPIQGTAADIIKKAMIEIDTALRGAGMGTRLVLQVHDELILEVPEEEEASAERMVVEIMEGVATLDVPLVVDVSWGRDLAAVKG